MSFARLVSTAISGWNAAITLRTTLRYCRVVAALTTVTITTAILSGGEPAGKHKMEVRPRMTAETRELPPTPSSELTHVIAEEDVDAKLAEMDAMITGLQQRLAAAHAGAHGLAQTLRAANVLNPVTMGWAIKMADDLASATYVWGQEVTG